MQYTEQQAAILDAALNSEDNLLVVARAGAGKTFTLVEIANRYREQFPAATMLVLAFNVKIKKELETRLGAGIQVKTLNGIGHSAIARALGKQTPLVVSANKMQLLMRKFSNDIGDISKEEWIALLRLLDVVRVHCLLPEGEFASGRGLVPDTQETWEDLIQEYNLDVDPSLLPVARKILIESIREAFKGRIDFTDQCYIPVVFPMSFYRHDLLLVDEAQDLSSSQHWMVAASKNYNGRIFAVGDPAQAIYGFRGAAADSMDRLQTAFNMRQLELSVSFRCSKKVIQHAQKLVPSIQHLPDAPEGEVTTMREWDSSLFSEAKGSVAILCRNIAPLIGLAFHLLSKSQPFNFVGRDLGKGILALARKIAGKNEGAFDNSELCRKIEAWAASEAAAARESGTEYRVDGIYDRADSLIGLLNASAAGTFAELAAAIDAVFEAQDGSITLASGHASKGLEWDNVFILDPHLIPSRFAIAMGKDSAAMQQERNLLYVMRTRAKLRLVYLYSNAGPKLAQVASLRQDAQETNTQLIG